MPLLRLGGIAASLLFFAAFLCSMYYGIKIVRAHWNMRSGNKMRGSISPRIRKRYLASIIIMIGVIFGYGALVWILIRL